MRALHAHSGNMFGGIERVLVTLAAYSDDAFQHEFALSFDSRLAEELRGHGGQVAVVGGVRISRPWTVWAARRHLAAAMARRTPDVVVTHSPWAHAVFAPAARGARVPVVHWLHAPPSGADWLERLAARHPPAGLICNSAFTCERRRVLFPRLDAQVVHPPVEPPRDSTVDRATVRSELDTARDKVVVAQVARLDRYKGQDRLLRALAELRDLPQWECWVVGGAGDAAGLMFADDLQQMVERLRLVGRVRLLGERRDVSRLLSTADVFCHPNAAPEPFGIVFVEAMYAGLPIVTTNIGGAAEIVTADTGILTPPGDDHAVAAALRRLVADGAVRDRLGRAGPTRARNLCDPSRQVATINEVLSRAKGSVG